MMISIFLSIYLSIGYTTFISYSLRLSLGFARLCAAQRLQVPRGGAPSAPEAAPQSGGETGGQEESSGEEFTRRHRVDGLGKRWVGWVKN